MDLEGALFEVVSTLLEILGAVAEGQDKRRRRSIVSTLLEILAPPYAVELQYKIQKYVSTLLEILVNYQFSDDIEIDMAVFQPFLRF